MGVYGTATGVVLWFNPDSGNGELLNLVDGDPVLLLSGPDMSLSGTLLVSGSGRVGWANNYLDIAGVHLDYTADDAKVTWEYGANIYAQIYLTSTPSPSHVLMIELDPPIPYNHAHYIDLHVANLDNDAHHMFFSTGVSLAGDLTVGGTIDNYSTAGISRWRSWMEGA